MSKGVVEGDVLAGKYRVEKVLASGGMGVVVAARHVPLDVLVALKFMTDEARADAEVAGRFLREARAAARLRSEHVARVSDVGTLESGAPYLVMEYLEGSDLSALLSQAGPQPIPNAVEFIVQACDALDEAHRSGIIHRDIKPSNLFLTTRPNGTACIKVLDFGISKGDRLGISPTTLRETQPRGLLGSPFYMAPEQMRAASEVDTRADIWALGATLYELLTGRLPFEAQSLLDLTYNVANVDPVALRERRPEIPWMLEQIVLRCLQKDPNDRFASVGALATALAAFLPPRHRPVRRGASSAERFDDADAKSASPARRSVPPGADSSESFGVGARLSWGGKSRRPASKSARATLSAFAAGFLLAAGSLAVIVAESRQSRPVLDASPTGGATVADATSNRVVSGPASSGAQASRPDVQSREKVVRSVEGSPPIPTLAVTDLPTSPPPGPMPLPSRLALAPAISSSGTAASRRPSCEVPYDIDERGHTRFKFECLDSPPVSSAPAPPPPPALEVEENPY
jgi:serine/threonine-protein kinase